MDVATAIIALLCGVIVLLMIMSEGRDKRTNHHDMEDKNASNDEEI